MFSSRNIFAMCLATVALSSGERAENAAAETFGHIHAHGVHLHGVHGVGVYAPGVYAPGVYGTGVYGPGVGVYGP
ncbi:hypothetical protein PR001_g33411, partial [Phytophthora rubi]